MCIKYIYIMCIYNVCLNFAITESLGHEYVIEFYQMCFNISKRVNVYNLPKSILCLWLQLAFESTVSRCTTRHLRCSFEAFEQERADWHNCRHQNDKTICERRKNDTLIKNVLKMKFTLTNNSGLRYLTFSTRDNITCFLENLHKIVRQLLLAYFTRH